MELAADCASTRKNSPGSDTQSELTDRLPFLDSTGGAAWPFSVCRVICLVSSVCKDWQIDSSLLTQWVMVLGRSQLVESLVWLIPFLCEKRREKMKEKMKEKIRRSRENEERWLMKRDERFFLKYVSGPSNPPDELARNVSKQIPLGRIIPPFFFES